MSSFQVATTSHNKYKYNSIQFNLLRKLNQPTENEVVSEGLAAHRNHYGSCKVLATALQLPVMISEPPKPPSQLWHTLDVQRCNQFEHPRYCVRIIFSVMPLILWKAKENKKQEIAVRRQKQRTRICHKRQIFDLGDRQMWRISSRPISKSIKTRKLV